MKWLRLTLAVVLAGLVWIEDGGSQAHACSCAEVADEIAIGHSDERDPESMARYVVAVDGVLTGDAFERQVVSTPQSDTLGPVAVPTGGDDPGLVGLASPIVVESTTKSFPLWMVALLGVGLGAVGLKLRGRRRSGTHRSGDGES